MSTTEPTWENQIATARALLKEKGFAELERHANVALRNRCNCHQCFCCAALAVVRDVQHRWQKNGYL